jgi:multiple sugar transport system substrate-binding protein
VIRYRGLTWDHPRGYNALAAAARHLECANGTIAIDWDKQPLEGFESHPIQDLCARYDLVVLDHPHVGEAVEKGCLIPLEQLFGPEDIATWSVETIGRCLDSYRYAGGYWALPLDAATQVMALRTDLVGRDRPDTWEDVLTISARLPVVLSLAGPHAILTFLSIATAHGERPGEAAAERLVSYQVGEQALDVMASLFARMPVDTGDLNPIALLEDMARRDRLALCPLVYGYVTYAAPREPGRHAIGFHEAPRGAAAGRRGSTLGGTGIGVSRRCKVTPELLAHLEWLLSAEGQTDFIPRHDGQPSRRQAWHDAAVNARSSNFYANTIETMETAYVRPRFAGYIAFQSEASDILRRGLAERTPHRTMLQAIIRAYDRNRRSGAER